MCEYLPLLKKEKVDECMTGTQTILFTSVLRVCSMLVFLFSYLIEASTLSSCSVSQDESKENLKPDLESALSKL